jgi:hypothetical protein
MLNMYRKGKTRKMIIVYSRELEINKMYINRLVRRGGYD